MIEGAGKDTPPLVLVVDDDVTHRIIAREALERAGFAVEEASSGAAALELCGRVLPDAVLLDVVMPEMDGYATCAGIRRLPEATMLPVLMITGLEDPLSIEHAYEAGATEFTIKPVNWNIEVHRVRYLVRAAALGRDLRERERQLMQAQKLESVGLLTSGIAHDFNNVLMAIGGFAQLGAKRASKDESLLEIFGQISTCSDRAAGLTRQLLKFSKQQASEPVLINVRALIDGISGMLRHVLGHSIKVSIVDSIEDATVLADETHLEQVLMNLAVNARDAMPEGGELTIGTSRQVLSAEDASGHPEFTPGPYVVLTVADTGCGMDEATQERIFEPFFTTKRREGGTGLGMSTVHGIVQKYGGHMRVNSELGEGTRFLIYLPAAALRSPVSAPESGHLSDTVACETILVVDDDDTVRRIATEMLQSCGYEVHAAADADQAELLFADEAAGVELLLSDVVMPGCDGPTLYQRLAEERADLRVLFMSAYAPHQIRNLMQMAEGQQFIRKPFTARDLRAAVHRAIHEVGDNSA